MGLTPLVAYCCFGDEYARMLEISLRSLAGPGQYQGRVALATDLDKATLERLCPMLATMDALVERIDDPHPLAGKLARYRLHRWFDLARSAPVLYVDCDIVFDRPVAAILHAIDGAGPICFPSEPSSVAMWSSMGGNFFRAAGLDVAGCGFNSGTMGIPNGCAFEHRFTLQLIGATIQDIWTHDRLIFDRWIDQPVVNYLHARHAIFDTDRLTPFFRYSFQNDRVDSSYPARAGAVHFFDDDKAPRMLDYLERVLSSSPPDPDCSARRESRWLRWRRI